MLNNDCIPSINQDFSQYCLNLFYELGIRTIFTIPGAHIEHFLLAVVKDNRFKLVVAAHEEGAGYMADGYFRKSRQITAVATINGPGLTNLVTTASTAKMDHSSILFISGDTPSSIKHKLGFQSSAQDGCKTADIMKIILDKQAIPEDSNQLYEVISDLNNDYKQDIFYPMHINLYNDILKLPNNCNNKTLKSIVLKNLKWNNLEKYRLSFNKAVVVLGEDLDNKADIITIINFCEKFSIPMVCTLGAKNTQALIPKGLFCGVYGYAGNKTALQLLSSEEIENIYFFGTELNERNTMGWSHKLFQYNREIYSISKFKTNDGITEFPIQYIQSSIESFIEYCNKEMGNIDKEWFGNYIYRPRIIDISNISDQLRMDTCLMIMNSMIDKTSNFFLDSGEHRIYGSVYWDVLNYNTFFNASKNAPMGWAIAAGIGATFVDNSIATWVLTGDGCMLMHGNELSVANRYNRNIKFIVINNGSYGRIDARLSNEDDSIRDQISRLPDISWAQYANSFGIQATCVKTIEEFQTTIKIAQDSNSPYLIEVMINMDNEASMNEYVFSSTASSFNPFKKVV